MAAIIAQGKAEEERLRTRFEERRNELRLEHEQLSELLCRDLEQKIISGAKREAALIRLRAEHSLLQRLHERASINVMQMHVNDPLALFCTLVDELPPDTWLTVQVNPVFASLAADCFPGAGIVPDATLSAGFKVVSADKSLTVDNTLGKRLERLWPDLATHILSELRKNQA